MQYKYSSGMFEIGYMLGVSHNRCFGIYPEHGQLACRVLRTALDWELELRLVIGVLFVQARRADSFL